MSSPKSIGKGCSPQEPPKAIHEGVANKVFFDLHCLETEIDLENIEIEIGILN